jgi:transposase
MEIATKRVNIQRLGELKPGVLRVRSDGKRIYAEDFKADLVRQCLVPGSYRHGPRNQRQPAAPLDRAANCSRQPNGCATGAVACDCAGTVPCVLPNTFSIAHICSAGVHRDRVPWCTNSPARPGRCTASGRRVRRVGAAHVIGLPSGTRVWIAAGHTDMRKGFDGLAALVQTALAANPHLGQVFVFRGRRGDIIKVLWSDGQGLLLLAKRLEKGRFIWPQATSGSVSLTPAQLSMLLEGIDWRMPARTWQPEMVV